jgi:hypothetical protein
MYNRLNVSNLEYYITKTFEIVGYAVLSGKVLKAPMGLVFSQAGKVNKCIQNFGRESSWKMIT